MKPVSCTRATRLDSADCGSVAGPAAAGCKQKMHTRLNSADDSSDFRKWNSSVTIRWTPRDWICHPRAGRFRPASRAPLEIYTALRANSTRVCFASTSSPRGARIRTCSSENRRRRCWRLLCSRCRPLLRLAIRRSLRRTAVRVVRPHAQARNTGSELIGPRCPRVWLCKRDRFG